MTSIAPRYVCIHGHFYQPPREDPVLDRIEHQPSAAPYHDWNERIAAECYGPNARLGNFERISFNAGPTLLSWLERYEPDTYAAILEADRRGAARFNGHGPAIAQVYNHVIMPLANERDQRTQVRWGVADFRRRFGREPEGMWLAETAVDLASLEALAVEGIRFTILAPLQARRVRPLVDPTAVWAGAFGGGIDPSRAYRCDLPSGRSIALFFYDAPVSHAIAFERLLDDGSRFAERLLGAFHDDRAGAQLVHVATDGETYGHHSIGGERGLASALDLIDGRNDVRLTNYGEFLERHPPEYEVKIVEDSAWSCAHGLGRWSADCGCRYEWGTRQEWRGPLRAALDALNLELAAIFERKGQSVFGDPWRARDEYVDGSPPGPHSEATDKLLEMQRNALFMFTSCGWFFDDIAGLEAVQILRYAARAIDIAEQITGVQLEPAFRERLAQAPSNNPAYGDGARVWDRLVRKR